MVAHVAQALELQRHLLVQAGTVPVSPWAIWFLPWPRVGECGPTDCGCDGDPCPAGADRDRDIPRLLQALEPRPESQAQVALLKGRNNYLCLHKLEGGYPEDEPDALFDMPSSTSRVGEEVVRLREWADRTETGDRDELKPGVSDRAWAQVRSAPPSVWVAAARWWKSALARWRVAVPLRLISSSRTTPCWRLTLSRA